jgi:spermidine synthase
MVSRESSSALIRTENTEDGRELVVNGRVKDLVDTIIGTSHARFVAVMDLPAHFFLRPGSALLLGLGSGSIARNYLHQQWAVRAVEPDSGMIRTAAESFRTPPLPESLLIHDDGRAFLDRTERIYDVILVDGISSPSLPTQLITREFFTLSRRHLSSDGMMAVAFEAVGWDDPLIQSVGRTMRQEFKQVFVLPIVEPPNLFGSVVLMGTNLPRDLVRDPERNAFYHPDWRYGPEYQKVHAWDNRFAPDTTRGIVLTDGFNKHDLLLARPADSAKAQPADYLP